MLIDVEELKTGEDLLPGALKLIHLIEQLFVDDVGDEVSVVEAARDQLAGLVEAYQVVIVSVIVYHHLEGLLGEET